jgi:hypothetical protein
VWRASDEYAQSTRASRRKKAAEHGVKSCDLRKRLLTNRIKVMEPVKVASSSRHTLGP